MRRSYSSPSSATRSVAPSLTHGSRFEPYTFEEVTSIRPKLVTNAVSRSTSEYTPERVATIGTSIRSNLVPSVVSTSVYTPERVILNPGRCLTSVLNDHVFAAPESTISTREDKRTVVDAVRGHAATSEANLVSDTVRNEPLEPLVHSVRSSERPSRSVDPGVTHRSRFEPSFQEVTSIGKISARDEIRAAVDAVRGQKARSNLVAGGGGERGARMRAGDGLW